MNSRRLDRMVWAYALLLVLCGIGYAKYDNYQLDGDAVAFMDIADALHAGDFAHAANGYWNPLYAAALLIGQLVAHPTRWNELETFFFVNFWIFVLCILACMYFVRSLVKARDGLTPAVIEPPALSPPALMLIALGLLFASFQRELPLGAVRSDSLLLLCLLLAAAFLLRLESGGRFVFYPLLGAALGLAYLTKSFAFLPSGILLAGIFLFGLTRKTAARKTILAGAVVASVVFLALAAPFIAAISIQRGRPTTGESARLNYAFDIDEMGRWHEWHSGDMGHAASTFKNHEELLLDRPPVYSYQAHPYGTYPLWFDPAYWTDTVQPKFWLTGHIRRLVRCTGLLFRFLFGHPDGFIVLAVLLFAGCSFPRPRAAWLSVIPLICWGCLMVAIYFPIDLQDRYLTSALLLTVIPALAVLRRPAAGPAGEVATAVSLLLALMILGNGVLDTLERRRMVPNLGLPRAAYNLETYPAAQGLADLGIHPGQAVACFGDRACYVDHYWARLAGTPIRAEIETPNYQEPGVVWAAVQNKQEVCDVLRRRHIAAIVTRFAPSAHIAEGWQQLGASDLYAYVLNPPPAAP